MQTATDTTIQTVDSFLDHTLFDPATVEGALLYAVLALVAAALVARLIRGATRRSLSRYAASKVDTAALSFVSQLGQVTVFIVVAALYAHLIPELRALGTALLASVSLVSVVIGFAAQQTLGNLIAGISLLVYRPFRAGEWLEVTTPNGAESGFVEDLTLGYTILHTLDKRRIVIPNSLFTNQVTVNQTMRDEEVTVNVTVPVTHDADAGQACGILRALGETHPLVYEVVEARVMTVTERSTLLLLRVRCAGTVEGRQITFDVLEGARLQFAAEGIALAYSYRNHPPRPDKPDAGLAPEVQPASSA